MIFRAFNELLEPHAVKGKQPNRIAVSSARGQYFFMDMALLFHP